MTRQMIFLEDKEGSHNGIDLTSHKQGDVVSEDKLSEYLKNAWEEAGSIEEFDSEADYDFEDDEEEDTSEEEDEEGGEDGKDNNSEGEDEQEGESDTEGEEGSSEDEGNESGEGESSSEEGDDQEKSEKDDVQILKDKAIALIAEEEKDIDAIKKAGLELGIEHLDKCSKPETILAKVKAYLEA